MDKRSDVNRAWWSDNEMAWLREKSTTMTLEQIAIALDRSPEAVRLKASRLGISVTSYAQRSTWCIECGRWRVMDSKGACPVCRHKAQLSDLRSTNDLEREKAVMAERKRRESFDAEVIADQRRDDAEIEKRKDAIKQDTQRQRRKTGTRPRADARKKQQALF